MPHPRQPPYDHDQTHIIDDRVERVCVQQGVCQNTGGRKLSSAFCNSIVLHIGLDIIYLAFVCYLHLQFFNHHRYRADGILIPVLRQALFVVCHPIKHPAHIPAPMTLPTRPYAIFSTLQGTQNPTHKSQPCKELKMPTHSPPTPADEYLSSLVQHISNITLLSTNAHPPPN